MSKHFKQLKKMHRELRDDCFEKEFNIRIHRSLSWLNRAEQEDKDMDAKFIFLWISLNSAYSIHLNTYERHADEGLRLDFFKTLLKNGQDKIHVIIYKRFFQEVKSILDNAFILTSFWQGKKDWKTKLKNEKKAVQDALRNRNDLQVLTLKNEKKAVRDTLRDRNDTDYILGILFRRLYVLRNQIFHGGATWQGKLNRQQVEDGASLLSYLVPVMLEIMMKNPKDNWGILAYPPTADD